MKKWKNGDWWCGFWLKNLIHVINLCFKFYLYSRKMLTAFGWLRY